MRLSRKKTLRYVDASAHKKGCYVDASRHHIILNRSKM